MLSAPKPWWALVSKSMQAILRNVLPCFTNITKLKNMSVLNIARRISTLGEYFTITGLCLIITASNPSNASTLSQRLCFCQGLRKLQLIFDRGSGYRPIEFFVRGLATLRKLEELTLSYTLEAPQPMHQELGKALAKMSQLKYLYLQLSGIKETGIQAINEGLAACTTLHVLALPFQNIQDSGAALLGPVLTKMPLKLLNLSNNALSATGIEHLMPLPSELTVLKLRSNNLSDNGAGHLSNAMLTLNRLEITNNNISAHGLAALFNSKGIFAISKLHLNKNKICTEGVKTLAMQAPRLPLLEELHLQKNDICTGGGQALAELLTKCTALKEMDLKWNDLQGAVVTNLLPQLENCKGLRALDLQENNQTSEQVEKCREIATTLQMLRFLV
tara:strand:+ start:378 stop:1544 length:1167 start_codon:yes stop_codon:yes gene_type:complete